MAGRPTVYYEVLPAIAIVALNNSVKRPKGRKGAAVKDAFKYTLTKLDEFWKLLKRANSKGGRLRVATKSQVTLREVTAIFEPFSIVTEVPTPKLTRFGSAVIGAVESTLKDYPDHIKAITALEVALTYPTAARVALEALWNATVVRRYEHGVDANDFVRIHLRNFLAALPTMEHMRGLSTKVKVVEYWLADEAAKLDAIYSRSRIETLPKKIRAAAKTEASIRKTLEALNTKKRVKFTMLTKLETLITMLAYLGIVGVSERSIDPIDTRSTFNEYGILPGDIIHVTREAHNIAAYFAADAVVAHLPKSGRTTSVEKVLKTLKALASDKTLTIDALSTHALVLLQSI